MKKLSKLIAISLCILMMTVLFTGCSKKEQEQINFFNYGENIDDETIKEFEKTYNIKVNMETFDDMEAMYQKINSGAGKYDVVLVSDALMPRMIEKGLVQKLNKDNIPNISQMDKQYLHWIVSDGTQKMTLLIGGFESYWNKLYEYACKNSPKTQENVVIRFESHRANIAIPCLIDFKFDKEHSLYALENLRESVVELKNTSNAKFYKLTYFTQLIATYGLMNKDYKQFLDESQNCFEDILTYLKYPNEKEQMHLIGTWEALNAPRTPYGQATCGINNYIITLINAKEYKLALYCYEKIEPFNLNYSKYFYSRINLAKQEVSFYT